MVGEQMVLGLREPKKRGGKQPGAGRKKTGRCHDSPHRVRPSVTRHQPQHVVLRVRAGLPRLRKGPIYRAIRKAIERTLVRHDFRVVHVSIQRNHLHFLVEADSKRALHRCMQGLAISAAKQINAICGKRKGKVFAYRYHATRISSPRQAPSAGPTSSRQQRTGYVRTRGRVGEKRVASKHPQVCDRGSSSARDTRVAAYAMAPTSSPAATVARQNRSHTYACSITGNPPTVDR